MSDIFDRMDQDIFDRLETEDPSKEDVQSIVKKELAKIQPSERIIEKPIIQNIHIPVPVKQEPKKETTIIYKTEVIEKKDNKKYAEKEITDDLKKQNEKFKKEINDLSQSLNDTKEILPYLAARGGSGVVGLPNPSGQSGKFLTTDGNGFNWSSINSLAIGNTVSSGTSGSVLFIDSSGNLAQNNASLNWNDSSSFLTIGGSYSQTSFLAAALKLQNTLSASNSNDISLNSYLKNSSGTLSLFSWVKTRSINSLANNETGQMDFSVSCGLASYSAITLKGFNGGYPRIGINQGTPTAGLHILGLDAAVNGVIFQGASSQTANLWEVQKNDSTLFESIGPSGDFTIQPDVRTSGSPSLFTLTGPAHTTLTAGEVTDMNINLARTVQISVGSYTNQRAILFKAPTYSYTGASSVSQVGTLAISGAPVAGTNAVFGLSSALILNTGYAGARGMVINMAASQSAAPFEVRTSGNVASMYIDNNGTKLVGFTTRTDIDSGFDFTNGLGNFTFNVNANFGDANALATTRIIWGTTNNRPFLIHSGGCAFGATVQSLVPVGQECLFSGDTVNPTKIRVKASSAQGTTNLIELEDSSSNDIAFFGPNGDLTLQPKIQTTGSPSHLTVTGSAHTTLTASVEASDIYLNLNRTVQFSTGSITTQRAVRIMAPTYGFVGASTITNAATAYIEKAPVVGTNATFTNKYALWVDADTTRLDGDLDHRGTNLGIFGTTPIAQRTGWTTSNVTTDRVIDANATSLDEVADVLSTLIEDLKSYGLIGA